MGNNKVFLIFKREYLKVILSKSFWIATLMFPLLMIVISVVSGVSSSSFEKKITEGAKNAKNVLILDESGYINSAVYAPPYQKVTDFNLSLAEVKDQKADALIVYSSDMNTNGIKIYAQDTGILSGDMYSATAQALLKQSLLLGLQDPAKISLVNVPPKAETKVYKDGVETNMSIEKFLIPGLSVVIYFILTSFAASYMLMSVAEEKENRIIETVLSLVKPKQLILGKLAALICVVLTQFVTLGVLGYAIFAATESKLPFQINWANVVVDPLQLLLAIFYSITGFLVMSNMMVFAASAVPTYKEANSFSSVFILASIFPIYFITAILADPSGILARILSFTPFTAPFILLFRNTLGELSVLEIIISIFVLCFYVWLSFFAAFKMFEIGSLEFGRKIDMRELFRK